MNRLQRTLTICVLMVITFSGIADAVQTVPRRGGGSPHMPGHFIHLINFLLDLDLTPQQKKDLQRIVDETRDTLSPLLSDMHALRSEMDEALLAEEIDTAQASALIEEMAQLKSHITTVGLSAMLQAAQILTPDQRRIILEARDEWKACFMRVRTLLLRLFNDAPAGK